LIPESFTAFFAACAGVAGALIGLLFVAVSVSHDRIAAEGGSHVHRLEAAAALTAFGNALSVSLFALIPGVGLGGTAIVVSLVGVTFVAASLLSIRRARRTGVVRFVDVRFLFGLIVIFALQCIFGLEDLGSNATSVPAARGIAILVIVCFIGGIARSWSLIGGPNIDITSKLVALIRGDSGPPSPG
jgi:hypothetical protein